ncbi:TPA: radical SAM protein [Candidatus Woesearchaeota archaeon]|nr:radical SAM protein [Candidatus Woesearchaeota archaeon]
MKALSTFGKGKRLSGFNAVRVGARLLKHSAKYPLYRHTGIPKILPKYARISVTDMCDSRCNMCHIWTLHKTDTEATNKYPKHSDFVDTPKLRSEMTFEEFKQFVDNNPFLEDIMLTGGQTSLKKDIVKYWLYLDEKGYRTGGPTNTVDPENVIAVQGELLSKLSGKHTHSIAVSVDGLGDMHDKIRGVKGGFEGALKFLAWAREQQKKYPFFDVSISHNLTPENFRDFPKFVDYFVNLGYKPNQITFRPTQGLTRFALKTPTATQIISDKSDAMKQELLTMLDGMRAKYKEYDDYYVRGIREFYEHQRKHVIPCYAGYNTFFADAYWNVYPCAPEMNERFKIGNLRENGFVLKPLWESERIKKIQDDIKNEKCVNCWTRCHSAQSTMASPTRLLKVFKDNAWRVISKPDHI